MLAFYRALLMVKSEAHQRQGGAVTNFDQILPTPQSDLAQRTLKDPYIFDFLTLEEPFHERELETRDSPSGEIPARTGPPCRVRDYAGRGSQGDATFGESRGSFTTLG